MMPVRTAVPKPGGAIEGRLATALTMMVVILLIWGALAFGAVYPWAFTPLLVGSLVTGATCMAVPGEDKVINRSLAGALGAIAIATAIQLVPVPSGVLRHVTPATDRLLRQYDLSYALSYVAALSGGRAHHALSIAPPLTMRALAFVACFGLLLVGFVIGRMF